MNMNSIKASLSLAALGSFVVFSVATSPATFSQTAQSEEVDALVAPEAPVRFLALHTSEDPRDTAIQLVARYRSFEGAEASAEDADADNVEAEVEEPIVADNAVRVLSQNLFELEALEIGQVQDNLLSRLELGGRNRCDSDRCAGYVIVTLEHERGEDADLVLKLEGQWQSLNELASEPTLELVPCTDDCQALADAFLSDNLDACALEEPTTCSPPDEVVDEQIEDAEQAQDDAQDDAQDQDQ